MATIVKDQEKVDAYAFCPDHTCVGYQQDIIEGLHTVKSETFVDAGGDGNMPGEYRSYDFLTFSDDADRACRFCGRDRQITLQERVEYPPVAATSDPNVRNDNQMAVLVAKQADEMAALKAELAKMKAGK